jgi:hypothetical protein
MMMYLSLSIKALHCPLTVQCKLGTCHVSVIRELQKIEMYINIVNIE